MKKVANQEELRSELSINVLHDLAVNPRNLPVTRDDGTRPIVVALGDEFLRDVFARVRACGEKANLFVELAANGDDRDVDEVVLFVATVGSTREPRIEDFDEPVPAQTTIGEMAEYVLTAPDGVQMRVELKKLGEVEYVERRDLVTA
jgi:hypothetical protein